MKFGIGTGPQNVTIDEIVGAWKAADTLGYDSAWLFDHLLPLSANDEDPIYEAWTLLGALARATENVDVGTLVSSNTFRHPALLAKMGATVDALSGGRLILGLGSGYLESEHTAYGIPLGSVRERADRLAEACEVLRGLWTERRFSYEGTHYKIADAPCEPKPVRTPHPPIMIGGGGEKLTLQTTARHADQWNMPPGATGIAPEDFEAKYAVLLERCAEVGRDPAEIETNVGLLVLVNDDAAEATARRDALAEAFGMDDETARKQVIAGDPAGVVAELRRFEAVGVEHFVLALINGVNYGDVELFAREVIPAFR